MAITTNRNIHIGAHVTAGVRKAMEEHCRDADVSMSAFIARSIEQALTREGVLIVEPDDANEPKLPGFESVTP